MSKFANNRLMLKLVLLCCLVCFNSQAAIILLEDFEDNNLTFSASDGLFFDTGRDLFTISPLNGVASPIDGAYNGFNGENFFAADDIDDPQGPGTRSQTLTFNLDISGFNNLLFSGFFGAGGNNLNGNDSTARYDSADGLRVRAQIDGGTIQDLLFFEAEQPGGDVINNRLLQDTNFDGIGDGLLLSTSLTAFNNIAINGLGSSLSLFIELHGDAQSESFAFDDITIAGERISTPPPTDIPTPSSLPLFCFALILMLSNVVCNKRA